MRELYVISGAAGMTGSELARVITAGGGTVIGFDNFFASSIETVKELLPLPAFKFFQYDLNNPVEMDGVKQLVLQEKAAFDQVIYINCAAVLALARTDSALDGSVYNVATQEEIAILDLVARIAHKLQIDDPVICFSGERASDPARRVLSTQKIRARTGWEPSVSLDDGLDMVLKSYRTGGSAR